MKLRTKVPVNYRLLHSGTFTSHRPKPKQMKWSRSFLWELEVLKTRVANNGEKQVLVHYTGWAKKFDEWRDISDIVVKPIEHTPIDSYQLFISSLQINIKESLSVSRVEDSEITVKILQPETFAKFIEETDATEWKVRSGQKFC